MFYKKTLGDFYKGSDQTENGGQMNPTQAFREKNKRNIKVISENRGKTLINSSQPAQLYKFDEGDHVSFDEGAHGVLVIGGVAGVARQHRSCCPWRPHSSNKGCPA